MQQSYSRLPGNRCKCATFVDFFSHLLRLSAVAAATHWMDFDESKMGAGCWSDVATMMQMTQLARGVFKVDDKEMRLNRCDRCRRRRPK